MYFGMYNNELIIYIISSFVQCIGECAYCPTRYHEYVLPFCHYKQKTINEKDLSACWHENRVLMHFSAWKRLLFIKKSNSRNDQIDQCPCTLPTDKLSKKWPVPLRRFWLVTSTLCKWAVKKNRDDDEKCYWWNYKHFWKCNLPMTRSVRNL